MKQIKSYCLGLVLASMTLLITSCCSGGSSALVASPNPNVAVTASYKVEYLPVAPANPTMGKTTFQLRITNLSDGTPATGKAVSLAPMMHMPSMDHSTPVDVVTESSTPGTYDCTVYYIMASSDVDHWELDVIIAGETATFSPTVSMPMGSDSVRATLYGPDDIVSGMSGTQYNKYYLLKDGSVTVAASTLGLFIAHGENMNMKFVPVSDGSVLSSPTGTVTAMTVQASMDSSFSSPLTAVDNGAGHWSVSGLTGLVSAQTTTIYVKLSVNTQDKTTNGLAASGSNGYATFIVTPQ
ncbi:MAG TPA: hypothetical protein VLN91_02350 [Nitrospirota bacterium]|nr:hypothetical protein [Nitrospirota bacterium]